MTRDELAEAVALWLARRDEQGRDVAFDGNHLGKLERGVVVRPRTHYVAALCAVLGATEVELGFFPSVRGNPDDVNRKTFLKTALGVGTGAWVAQHFPGHDVSDLAAAIAGPTAHYRLMESSVSTADLSPAVEAHLRLTSGLVTDSIPTSVGFGVLSETAGLAAWLAADRRDVATARRHYADAVRHAERARHPLLAAYMLASLGQFAVESGDVREGLALLQQARHHLDDQDAVPDAAHAWLASLHALAYAAMGERKPALLELNTADRLTGSRRGEPRWPWVFAFDAEKAARYQASTLARLGDLPAAAKAFAAARTQQLAPKPRAWARIDHADVLAHSGELSEACTLAVDAVSIGRRYRSERVIQRVRAFRMNLSGHSHEMVALDESLSALYTEGTS